MPAPLDAWVEAVSFDAAVFDLDTVKRAVYRFSAQCSSDISVEGSRIICTLFFNRSVRRHAAASVIDELRKEVLDQDLRQSIAKETAPVRNAILALAFCNPNLQDDE